ncbi:phosphopentomutase [Microvirga sp. 17 mud 1-3]|uniref:phosphopentomutase n=1 Tax=Microvirga sp. 17 mud 1-3 TaxID=2082949 RepID=UPI000D6AD318|nr:phosphopentomutase [Microvirga sp. 17 mud 1-3]AWM85466.1 phosphopentomutase [Microvirga sp. 17 mud 1-3]
MQSLDSQFDRVIILVLDALGLGAMPDVHLVRPNDIGSNTLKHVVEAVGGLSLPNLERLGLGTVAPNSGLRIEPNPIAVHGVFSLGYKGADTYLGHQVIMGSRVPDVPEELFEVVRDDVAAVLRRHGHHVEPAGDGLAALFVDGRMICGDNLESDPLQTYHCVGSIEDQPYEEIVAVGEILRSVARVRRVVAMGGYGFHAADIRRCTERRSTGQCGVNNVALGLYTSNYVVRHLTSGTKPHVQVPTILKKAGFEVELIGKVADVITCEGAHKEPHVLTQPVLDATYQSLARVKRGLIAINIQETDLAGHDECAERYAACLRQSDDGIGKIMGLLGPRDLLVITGDHGNDPTIGHDKHTREFTPLLVWSPRIKPRGIFLRETLADIAATVANVFNVDAPEIGTSFLDEIQLQ